MKPLSQSNRSNGNGKGSTPEAGAKRAATSRTDIPAMGPPIGLPPSQGRATLGTYGVMEKMYFKSPIPISVKKMYNNQQRTQPLGAQEAAIGAGLISVPQQKVPGLGSSGQPGQVQNVLQSISRKTLPQSHTMSKVTTSGMKQLTNKGFVNFHEGNQTDGSGTVSKSKTPPAVNSQMTMESNNRLEKRTNEITLIPTADQTTQATLNITAQDEEMELDETDPVSSQLIDEAISYHPVSEVEVSTFVSKTINNLNGSSNKRRRVSTDSTNDPSSSKPSKATEIAFPRDPRKTRRTNKTLSVSTEPEIPKKNVSNVVSETTESERSPSPDVIRGKRQHHDSLNSPPRTLNLPTPPISSDPINLPPSTPPRVVFPKTPTISPARNAFIRTTRSNPSTNEKQQRQQSLQPKEPNTDKRRVRVKAGIEPVWKDQNEVEKKKREHREPTEWWRVRTGAEEINNLQPKKTSIRNSKSDPQLSKSVKEGRGKRGEEKDKEKEKDNGIQNKSDTNQGKGRETNDPKRDKDIPTKVGGPQFKRKSPPKNTAKTPIVSSSNANSSSSSALSLSTTRLTRTLAKKSGIEVPETPLPRKGRGVGTNGDGSGNGKMSSTSTKRITSKLASVPMDTRKGNDLEFSDEEE